MRDMHPVASDSAGRRVLSSSCLGTHVAGRGGIRNREKKRVAYGEACKMTGALEDALDNAPRRCTQGGKL